MSLMKKRHNQKKGMHWNKNSWKEVQQCLIKNLKECHKPVPKERFEFSVRNVNLLPLNFWFNGQPTDLWGPCWLIRAYSNFISQLHSYHRDWSVMSKVPCTETKKKKKIIMICDMNFWVWSWIKKKVLFAQESITLWFLKNQWGKLKAMTKS